MKYKKSVEAIQWNGYNTHEVREFTDGMVTQTPNDREFGYLRLATFTDVNLIFIGDYIVKNKDGRLSVMNSGLFESEYEAEE